MFGVRIFIFPSHVQSIWYLSQQTPLSPPSISLSDPFSHPLLVHFLVLEKLMSRSSTDHRIGHFDAFFGGDVDFYCGAVHLWSFHHPATLYQNCCSTDWPLTWRHLADDLTGGVPVLNLTRLVKRRVSTAVAGGETNRLKAEKHCEQQHCQVSLACLLTGKARRE